MAIDSTVSGASANSYVSSSEADSYFEQNPFGQNWAGNEANLLYATVLLESLVSWKYEKSTTTQRLRFPVVINGVAQTVIPESIKQAQMEMALYLENNDSLLVGNSLKSLSIGSIDLDFNENNAGEQSLLPPLVEGFISAYGSIKSSGGSDLQSVDLVRG